MTERTTGTALITGASRGLGLALARRLAAEDWNLVIDARDPAALEAARAELSGLTRVISIPGDVTDAQHRRQLAEATRETGGLDAVVNNASILGPSPQPPLLDYPLAELERVYRANIFAPLAVVQAVRGDLKPGARIVNVTSDAAVEPYEGWGGYGSSKAALDHLSAILAAENPELRVYRVDPGDMRTRMHQEAFPGEDISDRPPPEESVPGLVELLTGDLPSGRYEARALTTQPPPLARGLEGIDKMFSTGLAEIVLVVEDVRRSARFYREVVGLTPEKDPGDDWAWFWAGAPGRAQRVALHGGPLLFEEHSPLPEGERWGKVHYAFHVPRERLDAAVDHLREGGVRVYGPAYFEWMRAASYYFYDPDGNLLEFWSPDPTAQSQRETTERGGLT